MSAIMGCPCYQGENLKGEVDGGAVCWVSKGGGGTGAEGGGITVKSKTFWGKYAVNSLSYCEFVVIVACG